MSSQNFPSALFHFALITNILHVCLLWPCYSMFKQDESLLAIRIFISYFWHRICFIFPLKREIFPPLEAYVTLVSFNPSTPQKTLGLLIILECLLFRILGILLLSGAPCPPEQTFASELCIYI